SSLDSATPIPHPHPFPTRRSSDLLQRARQRGHRHRRPARVDERAVGGHAHPRAPYAHVATEGGAEVAVVTPLQARVELPVVDDEDRKSTRMNSSHVSISYAVFCLK